MCDWLPHSQDTLLFIALKPRRGLWSNGTCLGSFCPFVPEFKGEETAKRSTCSKCSHVLERKCVWSLVATAHVFPPHAVLLCDPALSHIWHWLSWEIWFRLEGSGWPWQNQSTNGQFWGGRGTAWGCDFGLEQMKMSQSWRHVEFAPRCECVTCIQTVHFYIVSWNSNINSVKRFK